MYWKSATERGDIFSCIELLLRLSVEYRPILMTQTNAKQKCYE